ncbi:hypothetical protein EVAR_46215_1 [Eumeta japonica]|uniref:Uncharacterized protein n=1 Tax=Eumeta variegata TaxID=151549 RepID=A0A4C1WGE5_EUMVA|nr:hypothetical protein EVAR_46215_1 [Eumeta japonica]
MDLTPPELPSKRSPKGKSIFKCLANFPLVITFLCCRGSGLPAANASDKCEYNREPEERLFPLDEIFPGVRSVYSVVTHGHYSNLENMELSGIDQQNRPSFNLFFFISLRNGYIAIDMKHLSIEFHEKRLKIDYMPQRIAAVQTYMTILEASRLRFTSATVPLNHILDGEKQSYTGVNE